MGWKERSKCRQLLKCMSVFLLRPRSMKGAGRELAGSLGSWGSQGPRQPGHPYTHPAKEQGSRAAPAPGIRHLCGAGDGTEMGRTPGLWGAGHHHSFSLSPLLPRPVKTSQEQPFPNTWGMLPAPFVKPSHPRRCSSTGLGWCHLLVCLPKHCSGPTCLWHCPEMPLSMWKRWWEAALQILPVSLGPGNLPAQAKGRAGSWPRDGRCPNACRAPFRLIFWDLRARCCCPALCFHTIVSLGSAQGFWAGLSPEKRHRPA